MLEGYIPDKSIEEWTEASILVKDLNKHALEDIDDYIIIEGLSLVPTKKQDILGKLTEESMKERLKEVVASKDTKKIEAIKRVDALRPPYIWNLFLEEASPYNEPHRVRFNANPKALYNDGRVDKFLEKLESLNVQLVSHDKERWNCLVAESQLILEKLEKKKAKKH